MDTSAPTRQHVSATLARYRSAARITRRPSTSTSWWSTTSLSSRASPGRRTSSRRSRRVVDRTAPSMLAWPTWELGT